MKENWRAVLPGLGVAFGAAVGFVAYTTTGYLLYIAYGAGLGVVVGAAVAALVSKWTPAGRPTPNCRSVSR